MWTKTIQSVADQLCHPLGIKDYDVALIVAELYVQMRVHDSTEECRKYHFDQLNLKILSGNWHIPYTKFPKDWLICQDKPHKEEYVAGKIFTNIFISNNESFIYKSSISIFEGGEMDRDLREYCRSWRLRLDRDPASIPLKHILVFLISKKVMSARWRASASSWGVKNLDKDILTLRDKTLR